MSYNRTAYFGQARSSSVGAAAAAAGGAGPSSSSAAAPAAGLHSRPAHSATTAFSHGPHRGSGGRPRGGGGGRPRSVFEGHHGTHSNGTYASQGPRFAEHAQDDMAMEHETGGLHTTLDGFVHVSNVAPEGEARFAKWLLSKLYHRATIKQMQRHGQTLVLQMDNYAQACHATRFDGFLFSDQKLTIKCVPPVLPPEVAAAITAMLASRFDAGTNSLNLSGITNEPTLHARGIKHLNRVNAMLLLSQVGVNCPQVTTIAMDNNDIKSTIILVCLREYAPHVQNLSLKNNSISSYEQLQGLSQVATVRGLILNGNPLREQAEGNKMLADYKRHVVRRLPAIAFLDGEDVAPIRKVLSSSPVTDGGGPLDSFVGGIQATRGWFDQPSSQSAVDDFVTQYWKLYDEDRQQLLAVYDENALFSLSTGFPSTAAKGGQARRHRDKAEMMYQKYTRRGLQNPTNIIYPASAIIQALKSIPDSLHADRQSWYVDAWQQTTEPPTLFVNVTGVFAEVLDGKYTKRSFDRRFVLLPAPPGSPAHVAGWPVCIINDHLHVRPHVPMTREGQSVAGRSIGMSPATSPQTNAVGEMPSLPAFQFPSGITPEQQQMTQEFSLHTRLTLEFAFQCLAGVQFDAAKAVEAFEVTKAAGTLPAMAWLPS